MFVKRADFMSSVLNTHTHTHTHTQPKEHKEALGGVGYVLQLDWGDCVRGLCLCETYQTVHIKLV